MTYKCEYCNFATDNLFNFNKHNQTKKHIAKITQSDGCPKVDQELTVDRSTIKNAKVDQDTKRQCMYCNDMFSDKTSLSRHLRSRCLIKKMNETNEKLKILETKNIFLEDALKKAEKEKEHYRKMAEMSGSANKKSVSALTYLVTKHKKAPALKQITYDGAKKLLNYEKDNKLSDKIVYHHKKNILDHFIGDFIIKCYKKDNPDKQSIWNSDVSRLTYLIKDLLADGKRSEWVMDKKGVKLTHYIIKPIVDFIKELMKEYVKTLHELNEQNYDDFDNVEKRTHQMQLSNEVIDEIASKRLEKKISLYVSSHFQLNKDAYEESDFSSENDSLSDE